MIRLLTKEEPLPYDLLLLADETREAIDRYIHNSELYVLEQENEMIGVYALYPISAQEIEIKNIAIRTSCQGRGLGKLLLADAAFRAKAKGYNTLLIGTADAAPGPLYLYQKVGFKIYAIKENFFINNYPAPIYEEGVQLKDMVMLRKKLS